MKRVKIKVVLLSPLKKDGRKGIYLRAYFDGALRYFYLGRDANPATEWNTAQSRLSRAHPEYQRGNEMLSTYEQRAKDYLWSCERDGRFFSFEELEQTIFPAAAKKAGTTLIDLCKSRRDRMELEGRYNSSRVVAMLIGCLDKYKPKSSLSDVGEKWAMGFEMSMRARRLSDGTIHLVFSSLKAVCKDAEREGLMPKGWAPLSDHRVSRGRFRGVWLTFDEVRQIHAVPLTGQRAYYRAVFLLSFYLRGMNIADMARLPGNCISAGRLDYTRRKTGKRMPSIPIRNEAAALISELRSLGTSRLLSILDGCKPGEKAEAHRIMSVANKSAAEIRRILEDLCIDKPGVTFYSARYSYAMALKQAGVEKGSVQDLLGHGGAWSIDAYYQALDDGSLDLAEQSLFCETK